jgi:hypothetical protein
MRLRRFQIEGTTAIRDCGWIRSLPPDCSVGALAHWTDIGRLEPLAPRAQRVSKRVYKDAKDRLKRVARDLSSAEALPTV